MRNSSCMILWLGLLKLRFELIPYCSQQKKAIEEISIAFLKALKKTYLFHPKQAAI
jgi:hypothetical protein